METPDKKPDLLYPFKIDNQKQFLTAIFIEGEHGAKLEESEARYNLARHIAEIINSLFQEAAESKPFSYNYSTEIIREAIKRTRADGFTDSKYIAELEAMEHDTPTEETKKMTKQEISILANDLMRDAVKKGCRIRDGVVGVYYRDGLWTITTYAGTHDTKNFASARRMIIRELSQSSPDSQTSPNSQDD